MIQAAISTGIRQAVIVCGGFGTRMGALTANTPKPLLPVAGRPLLDYTIEFLAGAGIARVLLAAGYKAEVVQALAARFERSGVDVAVSVEPAPRGTAGAVKHAASSLDERFVVVYGDEFLDIDLASLIADHLEHGALGTILARPSTHPWDADLIDTDDAGRITEFVTSRAPGRHYRNLGNAGVYVLDREILDLVPPDAFADFAKDVFPRAISHPRGLRVHLMTSREYVKDMGTPARIADIERYLARRRARAHRLAHPAPVRTVFVDRDGVLNHERGLLASIDDLELLPGAAEGVRLLTEAGCRVVVVTNQPAVARGLVDESGLAAIHARLGELLAAAGAHVDAIYHCPHHPETHHGEGVTELRRACDCRKPSPGLILTAAEELGIDLAAAVMVGDSAVDIEAGENAGVRTVLVGTKPFASASVPTMRAPDLLSAARAILAGALDPVATT